MHSGEMTLPGSAGLGSRLLLVLDATFVGRSLQASFTGAAGNNIVAAFGCVRSHISGCSIRNRPQCRTINPWPQQQICAVTTQPGTINQTQREKYTLPPLLVSPNEPSLCDGRCAPLLSYNH